MTYLLKHVKDKYETIQDPGQSGRSSGGAGVVVVEVVVAGGLGLGRGLDTVAPEATPPLWWPRVLSQHTEPRWQLDVWAIRTDGRSQNAAMMLIRQKPGQRGSGGCDGVLGWLKRCTHNLIKLITAYHKHEASFLYHWSIYLIHFYIKVYSGMF